CFFFQAEDGIRDFHVTGVQTCALPILLLCEPPERWRRPSESPPPGALTKEGSHGDRDGRAAGSTAADQVRPLRPLRGAGDGHHPQIGRASCRERVERTAVAVS